MIEIGVSGHPQAIYFISNKGYGSGASTSCKLVSNSDLVRQELLSDFLKAPLADLSRRSHHLPHQGDKQSSTAMG
jgi:hypothetical protein